MQGRDQSSKVQADAKRDASRTEWMIREASCRKETGASLGTDNGRQLGALDKRGMPPLKIALFSAVVTADFIERRSIRAQAPIGDLQVGLFSSKALFRCVARST